MARSSDFSMAAVVALAIGFALAASVCPGRAEPPQGSITPSDRAEALHRSAMARLPSDRIEVRRVAMAELEQAVLFAPNVEDYWLDLGHLRLQGRFVARARQCFERAIDLDPGNPDGHIGLARARKQDWLADLNPAILDSAITELEIAARLDSTRADAWVLLAPLLEERHRDAEAVAAAAHAYEDDPEDVESMLCAASMSYRIGRLEQAERLFTTALADAPETLRARFEDMAPIVTASRLRDWDDLSPEARAEAARRAWSELDPDPTTEVNEARLEYWARVAHASLLFATADEPVWDMRGELYVRFGAPSRVDYEPFGAALAKRVSAHDNVVYDPLNGARRIGDPVWYPLHAVAWEYPGLGLNVLLEDRALSGHYKLPTNARQDPDPRPDPRALARSDLVAAGRAVFAGRIPGTVPLAVAGRVSRFEGASGPRLLAQIEAEGAPDDSLWAECVVIDTSAHEVAKAASALSPSPCDPAAMRTADFPMDVGPGEYRVAVSVHGRHRERGLFRTSHEVETPDPSLALSDLVVACGPVRVAALESEVRLAPNLAARVSGADPLVAYFEIYRLETDASGASRFEYTYRVWSEGRDRRPWYRRVLGRRGPLIDVSHEEHGTGSMRRQFISVPVRSLGPGRYRLEVQVRDEIAGSTTTGTASFVRAD